MTVREFFEAFAPVVSAHKYAKSDGHKMVIEISGEHFKACGEVSLRNANVSYFNLARDFDCVFYGGKDKKGTKTVPALDLIVDEWSMEVIEQQASGSVPEKVLLLKIEAKTSLYLY